MTFIFLSLECLWIYNCVVFTTNRVAVSWLCADGLAGAAAGNSLNSGGDFRLDHHAIKGRGGDQPATGKTQIAQPPARTDGAPCLSVVARFEHIGGASARHQNAMIIIVKLNGLYIRQAQRRYGLP